MVFLTVLIVAIVVILWGSESPLHRDQWFYNFCDRLAGFPLLNRYPALKLAAALLLPAILVVIVMSMLASVWGLFALLVAVPVVVYALGRGRLKKPVNEYLAAREQGDASHAFSCFAELNQPDSVDLDASTGKLTAEDWRTLDNRVFCSAGYRAFERIFAVIFWFLLLGPAGALVYRLTDLFIDHSRKQESQEETKEQAAADVETARHLRWVLEWPAVRVFGFTLAMTGNFVECMSVWKTSVGDIQSRTSDILCGYLAGAMNLLDDEGEWQPLTDAMFSDTLDLLTRTLVVWICLLAIITLIV